MKLLNKKKSKKRDLLELSDPEKIQMIKKAKQELRETITEAKLWHALLEAGNVAVNGNLVYNEKQQLNGLFLENSL